MSGLWSTYANMASGLGLRDGEAHARNRKNMGDSARRLGRDKHPYYGLAAQALIDQPHGMKKYADSVLGPRKASFQSGASKQLLGG